MKALLALALSLVALSPVLAQTDPTQSSTDTPYTIMTINKKLPVVSDKAFKAVIDEDTTSIKVTALSGTIHVYSMQWYRGGTFDDDWMAYSNGDQPLEAGSPYLSSMKFGYSKFCWIRVSYINPKTGKRESIDIHKPPFPDSDN